MKKVLTRKAFVTVVVVLACLLGFALFAATLRYGQGSALAEDKNEGKTFYYNELKNSELAQRFYKVMSDMEADGSFANGTTEYDLTKVLSQKELTDYIINDSPKIPVAFGAARDAFYMDHPDLFYLDVYKLYLSAGQKSDGSYVAYIDSGMADNYYADHTVSSAAEVQENVAKYETALNALVAAARAKSTNAVEQIRFVNAELAANVEYDYGARDDSLNGNVVYDGYVHTAYGALQNGKALCDGYARAFKAVMDRLDIPCVLIQGSAFTESVPAGMQAGYISHMWNAVKVDGLWYGVDVTWNSSAVNPEKYLLVGDDVMSVKHVEDGVISSSGFELKYPAIRPLDYGVNSDNSGFVFKDSGAIGDVKFGYIQSVTNPEAYGLVLGVSYDGKNAETLLEEGKYLAFRYSDDTPWIGFQAWVEMMELNADMSNANVDDYACLDVAGEQVRFAVFTHEPDDEYDFFGDKFTILYDAANITAGNTVAISTAYKNTKYGAYIPSPYVKKMTPDEKGYIKSFEPLTVTLEYSEDLVPVDESLPVGVQLTGTSSDLADYAKITDITWNAAENKLSFTLAPSKQYIHNCEVYRFVPTNLVSKRSGKVPDEARLSFKMKQVVCSKVFNDGRLYMKVFGAPQFVSASDESLNSFADASGKPIVGDQRSPLMLVVNDTTKKEADDMKDALLADPDIGLEAGDISASSTYQIDLQMCGLVQKVPSGSFMQVGFGFPDGYGPEDAGVTFTVYHYTRKPNGDIDTVTEVPCVITEYGIIATVNSFSPFMVCAIPASKASTDKNLLAYVNGVGGSVDELDIVTLASGDSITYNIAADDGYAISRVLLNGNDIKSKVGADGKLTLTYADLNSSNTLAVSFVSERAAAFYADNGVTLIHKELVVDSKDMIQAAYSTPKAPGKKSNVGMIVGIVIGVVLVLAGVAVALFFVLRKKQPQKATATATRSSKNASTTAADKKTATAQKTAVNKNTATVAPTRNTPPAAPTRPAPTKSASSTSTRPAPTKSATTRPTQSRPTDGNRKK